MTRYACSNPGCPKRDPVTADTAPSCYTCALPMAEATLAVGMLTRIHEDDFTASRGAPCEMRDGIAIEITPSPIGDVDAFARRVEAAMGPTDGADAVRAALLAIPGVTAAHVQTVGPGKVRTFVDGGGDEEILMCLYYALPAGIITLGNVRGCVEIDDASCELAFSRGAPPYSVGDEVEWRSGLGVHGWMPGRVASVVDDRPNDGIDKPFWIMGVDTAGKRGFAGQEISALLRRPLRAS